MLEKYCQCNCIRPFLQKSFFFTTKCLPQTIIIFNKSGNFQVIHLVSRIAYHYQKYLINKSIELKISYLYYFSTNERKLINFKFRILRNDTRFKFRFIFFYKYIILLLKIQINFNYIQEVIYINYGNRAWLNG